MDRLDYGSALDTVVERPSRPRSSSKKRKWREIEAIKDKQRLLKELQEIDNNYDCDIEAIVL